jgi:Protein of unknown function (DUF2778)
MWTWSQSAGELRHNGALISRGYSGNGRGKNNPSMQAARGVGPLPRGKWKIVGPPYDSKNVGLLDDTEATTGRGAFRIHGDSVANPGTASHGCIILPRTIRAQIWNSGDRDLEVVL